MSIEDLLAKLDGVREIKPGQWMARCPAHDDTNPSLSITDGGDKILLKCFAGCSLERICAKLGIEPRDLFYHDRREKIRWRDVAYYNYVDEEGNLRKRLRKEEGSAELWKTTSVRGFGPFMGPRPTGAPFVGPRPTGGPVRVTGPPAGRR